MLTPDKIERLNLLARKKKAGTLSQEEALEQQALRDEYMNNFRKHFRDQLDHIHFADEEDNGNPGNPPKH